MSQEINGIRFENKYFCGYEWLTDLKVSMLLLFKNEANQPSQYRILQISGYSGTAGDALAYHNNAAFTTRDVDNDEALSNCAVLYTGK